MNINENLNDQQEEVGYPEIGEEFKSSGRKLGRRTFSVQLSGKL
jgi:hypothetical protein